MQPVPLEILPSKGDDLIRSQTKETSQRNDELAILVPLESFNYRASFLPRLAGCCHRFNGALRDDDDVSPRIRRDARFSKRALEYETGEYLDVPKSLL
jgi:hypothetical protein